MAPTTNIQVQSPSLGNLTATNVKSTNLFAAASTLDNNSQRVNAAQLTVQAYSYTVLLKTLTGDYNGDNVVDMNDYLACQQSFGSTSALLADGNGDGVVDAADYTVWRYHLATPLGAGGGSSGASPVSEPSMLTLAASGLLGLAAWTQLLSRTSAGCPATKLHTAT
jgi:hypothetical protein